MEKKELISVIIPCYNVEKYVEKCFASLSKQDYASLEVIAIDDSSTDETYSLLKKMKEKYSIKLYKNEKNKGLAYTRNYGVRLAKGNIIGFIDPDDYIEENYFSSLYEVMKKENAQVAVTDVCIVYEGKEERMRINCCEGGQVNTVNILNCTVGASACNKLFAKELLQKYPFLEGKINEDIAATFPCIVSAKKLAYTNATCYYYMQRNTSIQNSNFSLRRFEIFDSIAICLQRIKKMCTKEEYKEYEELILFHQIIQLYYALLRLSVPDKKKKEYLTIFLEKAKDYDLYHNKWFQNYVYWLPYDKKEYARILVNLIKTGDVNKIIEATYHIEHFYEYPSDYYVGIKTKTKNFVKEMIHWQVIKQNLQMKDLVKAAIIQSKKKESDIKISVVVPNYNYQNFLLKRVYSILTQTEKISEIILLDDCSTDASGSVINEIAEKIGYFVPVKKIFNDQNSGCAFKQWQKGFSYATGDYVWIAEADDCCEKTLLENVVKPIRENPDKKIYLSYVDTAFINIYDKITLPTIKPEIDILKTGHWDSDYVNKGTKEVESYSFLNNTVANVSSCIIKKDNYDEIFEKIIHYRQAGDWLFYVNVIKRGYIAYTNKTLNYYKVHGENISSTMNQLAHFKEINSIHSEIRQNFNLKDWNEIEILKRYRFLNRVWELNLDAYKE